MAATFTLINKSVLSAATSTVTLSSIPATYTHLRFFVSNRRDVTGLDAAGVLVNGTAVTSYTNNYMDTNAGGSPRSGQANYYQTIMNPTDYGTNIFSFNESIITNYTGSNEKNLVNYFNTEATIVDCYNGASRTYTSVTGAVTSLTLTTQSNNYAAGTTFHLYGIANS